MFPLLSLIPDQEPLHIDELRCAYSTHLISSNLHSGNCSLISSILRKCLFPLYCLSLLNKCESWKIYQVISSPSFHNYCSRHNTISSPAFCLVCFFISRMEAVCPRLDRLPLTKTSQHQDLLLCTYPEFWSLFF